jgi:plasmid maintenance system killer protein
MRHFRLAMLAVGCLGSTGVVCLADIEADANKEYRLGPKDGPYMIYIASFRGDEEKGATAREQAQSLVYELRSAYKLQAYMFNRSEQEQALRDKQLKEMHELLGDDQYIKKIRIVPEWAVLIGNWPDRDSATNYLYSYIKDKADKKTGKTKAKLAPPQSVHGPGMFVLRSAAEMKARGKPAEPAFEKEEVNFFERAWVVRNPLLVNEDAKAASPADQALVAKLEAYNLAKCPREYSLVVMGFRYSGREDDPREMAGALPEAASGLLDRIGLGGSNSDRHRTVAGKPEAVAAAIKLADALKAKYPTYDVYIWPMTQSIVVTVGSFNFPRSANDANMKDLTDAFSRLKGKKVGEFNLFDAPYAMGIPRSKMMQK